VCADGFDVRCLSGRARRDRFAAGRDQQRLASELDPGLPGVGRPVPDRPADVGRGDSFAVLGQGDKFLQQPGGRLNLLLGPPDDERVAPDHEGGPKLPLDNLEEGILLAEDCDGCGPGRKGYGGLTRHLNHLRRPGGASSRGVRTPGHRSGGDT